MHQPGSGPRIPECESLGAAAETKKTNSYNDKHVFDGKQELLQMVALQWRNHSAKITGETVVVQL